MQTSPIFATVSLAVLSAPLVVTCSASWVHSARKLRGHFPIAIASAMSGASQTTELGKVQDRDFDQFMIFMVTFMRAREHAQADRLFSDVFAEPLTRQVAPQLAPRVLKWMEKTPRPENFVAIRTRYLDDSISQRNPHIRQVVLFRSGLDARAYRLEALRGCHVFEIDRNAELFAHKKTILGGLNAPLIAGRRDCIV
ncbi:hypothetical protein BBJ28_00024925, partial [Nothophytophthora sp. Chile5]